MDLTALTSLTLRAPREAARAILAAGIDRARHFELFLLVIALSGALGQLTIILLPLPEAPEDAPQITGLTIAALVGASILVLTFIMYLGGRVFGGTGDVRDALLLVLWAQFLMTVLQAVELVVAVLVPGAGGVLALVAVVFLLWLLTNFTAELHGFDSLARTFVGLVAAMLGLSVVMSVALTLLLTAAPS